MSNNALMNKTKIELVEIILRKDDVERNLCNQIKDLMDLNAKLEKQLFVQTESLKKDRERKSRFKAFMNKIKRKTKCTLVFAL